MIELSGIPPSPPSESQFYHLGVLAQNRPLPQTCPGNKYSHMIRRSFRPNVPKGWGRPQRHLPKYIKSWRPGCIAQEVPGQHIMFRRNRPIRMRGWSEIATGPYNEPMACTKACNKKGHGRSLPIDKVQRLNACPWINAFFFSAMARWIRPQAGDAPQGPTATISFPSSYPVASHGRMAASVSDQRQWRPKGWSTELKLARKLNTKSGVSGLANRARCHRVLVKGDPPLPPPLVPGPVRDLEMNTG